MIVIHICIEHGEEEHTEGAGCFTETRAPDAMG